MDDAKMQEDNEEEKMQVIGEENISNAIVANPPVEIAGFEVGALMGKYKKWQKDCKWAGPNVVVTFEACCREDFIVAFSPEPKYCASGMLEIFGGSHGNTEASIQQSNKKKSVFCGRICDPNEFQSYWILIQQNVVSFGLGSEVGQRLLVQFTEDLPQQEEGRMFYVAFSSWHAPVKYQHIRIDDGSQYAPPEEITYPIVLASAKGGDDLLSPEKRKLFNEACDKAKVRAKRFGGTYSPPDVKSFIETKEVRKLQRIGASEAGFSTGFDVATEAELAKKNARMKRFAGTVDNVVDSEDEQKKKMRAEKYGIVKDFKLNMSTKVMKDRIDPSDEFAIRNDGIHVFSLDENFQQVRTNDMLGYFDGFGPSYVEWNNDSSCTVVFQDDFTSTRAMKSLSSELPVDTMLPIFSSKKDQLKAKNLGGDTMGEQAEKLQVNAYACGWQYGNPITSQQNAGKKWRVLMRISRENDFPSEKKNKDYYAHSRSNKKIRKPRTAVVNKKQTASIDSRRNTALKSQRISKRKRVADSVNEVDFTVKSSKNINVNEDGSINMNRSDKTYETYIAEKN